MMEALGSINPEVINGSLIVTGSITAEEIAANTITGNEIAANAVDADILASVTLESSKHLRVGSIGDWRR